MDEHTEYVIQTVKDLQKWVVGLDAVLRADEVRVSDLSTRITSLTHAINNTNARINNDVYRLQSRIVELEQRMSKYECFTEDELLSEAEGSPQQPPESDV